VLQQLLGELEHHLPEAEPEKILSLKPVLKPGEIQRPEYEADPGAIFKMETVVAPYQPVVEEKKEIDPLHTEMVIIPGGGYERGSNKGGRDEMPRHQISLDAFAIDIHPVTNEQFVQFLEAMGGEKDHNNNDIIRLRESRIKRHTGKLSIESGYARHPVVGVTYYGAVAYAKWIGKRLPTEVEWEIAACAGIEEFIYPTGKDIDRTQANFFSSDTTPVASYPPNNYGLYDMAGNVYQWCLDWYDYHYYNLSMQEPHNPKGPLQGVYRVLRGGCWKSLKEDLRCSHRHRNNPGTMNGTYGFRCATDVAPNISQ
jgi:formylglycine-generating enzyme required for sulfatase activity